MFRLGFQTKQQTVCNIKLGFIKKRTTNTVVEPKRPLWELPIYKNPHQIQTQFQFMVVDKKRN